MAITLSYAYIVKTEDSRARMLSRPKIIGTLKRNNPGRKGVISASGMSHRKDPSKSCGTRCQDDKINRSRVSLDSVSDEVKLRRNSRSFRQGREMNCHRNEQAAPSNPLKNLHQVFQDSFLPEMYSLKESFSSQWLSKFLERLSTEDAAMTSLTIPWLPARTSTLIYRYHISLICIRNIDWLEWGYNRDGLDLPQVNLGLVLSLNRHMPNLLQAVSQEV